MDIDPPLFPKIEPFGTLPCGCKVYVDWDMDIKWKFSVNYCWGCKPILDLPEGTILLK